MGRHCDGACRPVGEVTRYIWDGDSIYFPEVMNVNDSEKRRQRLLEQTRELYGEKRSIPAIHPRYGAAYHQIYSDEQPQIPPSTFGIRLFLCLLLFAAFVSMDKNKREVMNVNSSRIVDEITTNLDVAEVWKEL